MKIQAFMLIAALLFFSALIQDCEGIGIFPPGKGKRAVQRKVQVTARSICEAARSLNCDGMDLDG
ncbi:unnamed protein product [Pocillopora meandrina]|uniref:Uncharacterized protein n=1 Tax=Pocillopora meandrina TaxID=46732 RepID=A0AAU9VK07_9CNID|nr:unnamed protein product [Pocillopora meandrina]